MKILNTRGGRGTPWINPEKSREINGGEIRSRRAGKVFNLSLTMPRSGLQRLWATCCTSDILEQGAFGPVGSRRSP